MGSHLLRYTSTKPYIVLLYTLYPSTFLNTTTVIVISVISRDRGAVEGLLNYTITLRSKL